MNTDDPDFKRSKMVNKNYYVYIKVANNANKSPPKLDYLSLIPGYKPTSWINIAPKAIPHLVNNVVTEEQQSSKH